ncbi:MAG: universal stress protein, partial [Opitutaceae bacterium]|nr:universal stress protein [Verrucomicrobiales bacterium]
MTKLLIAYDGSPCSDAAIDNLRQAALPEQLEAKVISVADVWLPSDDESAQSSQATPPAVATMRAQARFALESASKLAAAACDRIQQLHPRWKLTPLAVADSPAWAIIRQAETWSADLVVVGSHGRSILERLFLGSVAERVVAEAKCTVRICRPRQPSHLPRLLVAVDGSAGSEVAVREVAARHWPAGTVARVMAVVDPRLQSA